MVEETRENKKGIKGERKTGGNKYITAEKWKVEMDELLRPVEKTLRTKRGNCCGL